MRRVIVVALAVMMIAAVTGWTAGEQEADSDQPIRLRLAETHGPDYPTTQGSREFARLVEERTDGRIQIEVFHSAQLGEESDAIEQVQFGGIDFTRVSISPLSSFVPALDAFQMPFLYNDAEHMWDVLRGDIGAEMFAELEDHGFVGLTWYDSGSRNFYTTSLVESVADLDGLNIRVQESPLMMDMVELLGAVPVPMPFGEVYSGLQTGVIDGAENNWPSYLTTSHYEVARFFIENAHTRVPEITVASSQVWDTLSAEDQEIIRDAAWESIDYQRQLWAEFEEEAEEQIRAAGNTITSPSASVLAEMQERMQPLYDRQPEEVLEMIDRVQSYGGR
ncbi:MAG: TRAP transporter substrate-binding protein [Spirochaetaceae bacterium]